MTAKKSAAGAKKIETLSETEAKLWKFRHIRGNDSEDLRYGAIGTPEKYFPQWKEDEADNTRFKLDKYLLKMCRKERLIELLHDFVLFDGGGHPASDLHAFRRPGFWTQAQRELHLATVRQRITTPAILVVARAMIEAVDLTNGFCTISVAELARGLSCSTKTVTKSRAALRKTGLWIAGHRGVFVPVALNCNQAIDNTSRKQAVGTSRFHACTICLLSLPLYPFHHLCLQPRGHIRPICSAAWLSIWINTDAGCCLQILWRRITQDDYDKKARELKDRQAEIITN
jgi:hypothetical protein